MHSFVKRFITAIVFLSFTGFQANANNNPTDTLNPQRLRKVLISQSAFYVAGISFLQFIWYKDHEAVPFHFYNDNKGWLQLDKAGHAFSAYYESYKSYKAFRWAGLSEKKAVFYGGLTGMLIQAPIEVFDGYYEGYGFSKGDIVANTGGALLFMGQQWFLHDQLVKMKFSYSPSPYAQHRPRMLGENHIQRFFMDYNGHTYWLSLNLKKATQFNFMPPWLNLALGYSGNGMLGEFKNPTWYRGEPFPYFERYRQYLFSLDIDLSEVRTSSKFLRSVFDALNLIKIPLPTLEYNRLDGYKLHAVYF